MRNYWVHAKFTCLLSTNMPLKNFKTQSFQEWSSKWQRWPKWQISHTPILGSMTAKKFPRLPSFALSFTITAVLRVFCISSKVVRNVKFRWMQIVFVCTCRLSKVDGWPLMLNIFHFVPDVEPTMREKGLVFYFCRIEVQTRLPLRKDSLQNLF